VSHLLGQVTQRASAAGHSSGPVHWKCLSTQSCCDVVSNASGYDYIVPAFPYEVLRTLQMHHVRIRDLSWPRWTDPSLSQVVICDCRLDDDTLFMLGLVTDASKHASIDKVHEHRVKAYCTKDLNALCIHARFVLLRSVILMHQFVSPTPFTRILCPMLPLLLQLRLLISDQRERILF